jgi:hypothetical protein
MRRVSPTVAVAWLATSAAIVFVQAETRSAASAPYICSGFQFPDAVFMVTTPVGSGSLQGFAAEHTITVSALRQIQSCASALAEDLDKANGELEAQKGRLDSVEARLDALEGKAPAPDGSKPAPAPPNPSAEGGLAGRVAALEGEVTALKAQVEQLKNPARVRPGHTVQEPFIVVDKSGHTLLHVGQWNDPAPRSVTSKPGAKGGKDGISIDRTAESIPVMTIYREGEIAAQLSAGHGGAGGRVVLKAPSDTLPRVVLDAGNRVLALSDGNGRPMAVMSDEGANGPMIAVMSPSGETLAGLSQNPGGGRVFANLPDSGPAFRGGAVGGGAGDACIWAKRGPVCLNTILPLR